MKNLFLSVVLLLTVSFAFANVEEVKPNKISLKTEITKQPKIKVVKAKQMWKVYCDGVLSGAFYCDCSQSQANAIGEIICNG